MDRSRDKDIVIDPLDFFDLESDKTKAGKGGPPLPKGRRNKSSSKRRGQGLFITGTDTEVGKTIATAALGLLLKQKGCRVGVMKPFQCGGNDASFLIKTLDIKDALSDVNPYYSKEAISPHLAFKRKKQRIDITRVRKAYLKLLNQYDILLVEGAGGICVPITENYFVTDLICDLGCECIVVSRLGLGTINHTLLTLNQAREAGIGIRGVIFNEGQNLKGSLPEKTNPSVIRQLGGVPVIGTIPCLKNLEQKEILSKCRTRINVGGLVGGGVKRNTGRQLASWDKRYVWHPFTQMKEWLREDPLIIEKGRGSLLIDSGGKKYIDGVSSLWVNVHGHQKKDIDRAVKAQLNRIGHTTMLGLSSTPGIELARKLVSIAPKGLEKVFYSDNGSTAVEIAVKMAYQYWQNSGYHEKTKIVHLSNSYHGDTLGSVSIGGIDLFHRVYKDLIFKAVECEFPDGYRTPDGRSAEDMFEESLEKLESLFKNQNKSIAAFVVEPIVQGAAGMLVWPKGILKKMSDLCSKYNIFLVADEVATGFGRTGKMFACEHEGVTPDLLCLAKGLTGGYLPLAATLTTKKVFDGFLFDYKEQKTFFHGHTYTGNPLCCAAALANIRIFEQERTLFNLQKKIHYLEKKLKDFQKLDHVGDVRQKGFMVGIELVKDKKSKEPYHWEEQIGVRVCREVRKRGVILRPLGNVIVIMPPLSIFKKEMDYLLNATYSAIEQVTQKGHASRPRRRRRRPRRRSYAKRK